MSAVKTQQEIMAMREGGKILAGVLDEVSQKAVAGATTAFLNAEAERLIRAAGATPSFLGYRARGARTPYPATLCTSVNDEVVHGIPSERVLREGDIIGLDIGLWYRDLCVDMAITVPIGTVSEKARHLIVVTRQSLYEGIAAVHAGARTGDIGYAVEQYVKPHGFGIVRELAGHGVGHAVHEEPPIMNFGKKGTGELLEAGMTIALEPMVTEKGWQVKTGSDGWTIKTADESLAAHFEHTVLVTKDGCEILTVLH